MEVAGFRMKDKYEDESYPKNSVPKEMQSNKEDFELFYEKDLGVFYDLFRQL